jgi:hypothetical protein
LTPDRQRPRRPRRRGTEWAATGKVARKVPANFPTESSVSYRIDLADMDPSIKNPHARR